MSADTLTTAKPQKKKATHQRVHLKVVFDTNALYVTEHSIGSASDLVRPEIANLISESKYPDLDISWHLPEVVRHERQYQMQTHALNLRGSINKIEKLLSHSLLLTDQALVTHVKTKIDETKERLGLQELTLRHESVDWPALIHAAQYRLAPFQVGDKEKGFRDALLVESFLQLVADSPKTPAICRVVLVTSDVLTGEAVKSRIATSRNASVLTNIEELRGLINTIVSNAGEAFISQLQPKATRLFFVTAENQNTLYFKEKIAEKLTAKFRSRLDLLPEGTMFRKNLKWHIHRPNFSRKDGRRIFWTSRLETEVEAGTLNREENKPETNFISALTVPSSGYSFMPSETALTKVATSYIGASDDLSRYLTVYGGDTTKRVVTHKGRDVYEVLWSTEVTMTKELKKAKIEDIKHVALNCQPIQ